MMLQYRSFSWPQPRSALYIHIWVEATQRGNECEGVNILRVEERKEKNPCRNICAIYYEHLIYIYNLEAVQTIWENVKRLSRKIFMWKVMDCIKTNDDIKLCHTKPILLLLSSLCAFVQVSVRSILYQTFTIIPQLISINSYQMVNHSHFHPHSHAHIHTLASHTNSFNVLLLRLYRAVSTRERGVEMNLWVTIWLPELLLQK